MRLVKHLFRKNRFREDPNEDDFFIANIPLRVNKEQYEMLVNSDIHGLNIQEIDGLVEDVLMQSRDDKYSIPHILFDFYREEIISAFRTPVICIAVFIAIIILIRLFHSSSYSTIIITVILAISVLSYSMMYHDCLDDLEIDRMIQLSKEESKNNPCKDYQSAKKSVLSSLFNKNNEDDCHKHMRLNFKSAKNYCDPLEVFARWSAKIHMSYIGSMTESFLEIIMKMTSSSNIFSQAFIWIASMIFFAFLIITIFKEVIKRGFLGIFSALSSSTPSPSTSATSNATIDLLNTKLDAIANENREMKREVRMLRECSVERSLKNSPPQLKRHKMSSIEEAPVDQDDTQ